MELPIVVEFDQVRKSFGAQTILSGLNFAIGRGEFVCLLGPNGAGKSTTIGLLVGMLKPDSGTVKILNSARVSPEVRARFGYAPQDCSFPSNVTARQWLSFVGAHFAKSISLAQLAEKFDCEIPMDRPLGQLSGGQRRLVGLLGAFIGQPELVILDEPTVGLDLEVRRSVWKFLRSFVKGGGTILMTTHILMEAEQLADRVLVLNQGVVVQSGSPQAIRQRFGFKRITFSADEAPPTPIGAIFDQESWVVEAHDSDARLRLLMEWGMARDVAVAPLALEEVFIRIVEREGL
ncbi:MAG: ABC transporter ATP-binding protein [Bdellovibrionales bacterium]